MSWEQKTKPVIYGEPMKRRSVRLDNATVTKAQRLGNGNLSAGLRRAVELATDKVGRRSEVALQIAKRAKEIKRDMEAILTSNQGCREQNGE